MVASCVRKGLPFWWPFCVSGFDHVIRFTSNTREVVRGVDRFVDRQMPFALATALTATARDVEKNVNKRIERGFDRPTAFTKRAVFVKPATKSRFEASVGIKDRQAAYLGIQETGGTRTPQGRALVLPSAARVNRYGNIPRGAVARALSRADTFSGTVRGVSGIWQRVRSRGGPKLKLLYAYEPSASYTPRFNFAGTAAKTAEARFETQFWRAFARAVETAR